MLGAVLCTGCGAAASEPATTPATTSLPAGVTVQLVQLRGDIAPGRVQLQVANDSPQQIVVTELDLDSAVLPGGARWERDGGTSMAPGRTVNLPVILPDIACESDAAPPRVTGVIDTGDGPQRFEADIADSLDVLGRLSAQRCARDDVADVTDVVAASVVDRGDGTATLVVRVDPVAAGEGTVRLVALQGTTLLKFTTGEQWPLDVEVRAGDAGFEVPVGVIPRRCDAHAIGEDKVGTLLDLIVDVAGEEVTFTLPRSQQVAGDLLAFASAACGLS